jgi:type I restriction enzyme R subunit
LSNEADTCRRYVLPKLYEAGWTDDQISEQKYFTDGRIIPVGRKHRRRPGKSPSLPFRSSQRHSSARPDPADKLPQLL